MKRHFTLAEWEAQRAGQSSRRADITGQRFTRLVALQPIGATKHRNMIWLCACDCGGMKNALLRQLRRGETKSCGCLHSEVSKMLASTLHIRRRPARRVAL